MVFATGCFLFVAITARSQGYTVLKNFTGGDGRFPEGGLVLSGDTLYGTTLSGGSGFNAGEVFRIKTDGSAFTNLHAFSGGAVEGSQPIAGLVLSGGTLYGTTTFGGSSSAGTVFAVGVNGGGFTNLYSFTGGGDGGNPRCTLILSGNALYGTTLAGGSSGGGTVFGINTNGNGFTNICSFLLINGVWPYGRSPFGGLAVSGGTLYGTATSGGDISSLGSVFKVNINTTGFLPLHYFTGTDGAQPYARMTLSGNTFYGTTLSGGDSSSGTIFRINTDGNGFTNLYSFRGGNDGAQPSAGLVLSGNTLYGATSSGGSSGQGTLFRINTDGSGFSTLHTFAGGADGGTPSGDLVLGGNVIYGTTSKGGTSNAGTVFSLDLGLVVLPPFLSILKSGNSVIVSWPSPSDGFVLQQNSNLATINWSGFGGTINDNGSVKSVTVSPPSGSLFFRLVHP